MTDKWQAGKTYAPGSLVTPASAPVVDATQAENGDFAAGNSGWDYTGSCTFSSTGGYSNANCCIAPGVTAGGLALNKAKFLLSPGETISANCMIQQGASDVDHTRGYVQVYFYDATDTQIGDPVSGNIVNDGRGGAWHQSSLATPAAAPAGTAYARCGIYLYQNSADPIWGDNLVVYYARRKPAAGLIFKATQPAPGKSAQTEPVWPTSAGVTVTDNEVIWEGVIATRLVWEASPILKSGATEPTWPDSIGGAVHDGTIDWIAVSRRVEDVNCPNSKVVAIMASKVFAADGDIVRFSATVNPLDWSSSQNAGYLPTGLQQANANDMAVLAPYRSNLTAFNASSFQNWQVDPDPAAMALLDQMDGIGSRHQHAAQAVGNDLYYLSQLGVRTVSIAAGTDNLKAGDVGMPVDVLVRDSIRISTANDTPVVATYYPSAGQYWLAVRALQSLALSGSVPPARIYDNGSYQYVESGGVLPYGPISVIAGELPPGASLSPSGLLTYTYTESGDFAWTISGLDADGNIATHNDSLSIASELLESWATGYSGKAQQLYACAVADGIVVVGGNGGDHAYSLDRGLTFIGTDFKIGGWAPNNIIKFGADWYVFSNNATASISNGNTFVFSAMGNAPRNVQKTATVLISATFPQGALYVGADGTPNTSILRMNSPGAAWTTIDTGFAYGDPVSICQAGNTYFIACESGKIIKSTDLETFFLAYDTADVSLSQCAYLDASNVLVVSNKGGGIYRSADLGTTWTNVGDVGVASVTATRQEFIGARLNTVKKSIDGITWDTIYTNGSVGQVTSNLSTDGNLAAVGALSGHVHVGTK